MGGDAYNYAMYDDPYFNGLCDKALSTVDPTERDALTKELVLLAIDSAAYINIGGPYSLSYWWPWVKNYYGERILNCWGAGSAVEAFTWIDQDLKAGMGY